MPLPIALNPKVSWVLQEVEFKHPYDGELAHLVVIWAKNIPDDVASYELYQPAEFPETIGVKRQGHRGAGTGAQLWHYVNEEVNPGFFPYPVVGLITGSKTPGIFPFSKGHPWTLPEEKREGIRNLVGFLGCAVAGNMDYLTPPNPLSGFSFEY